MNTSDPFELFLAIWILLGVIALIGSWIMERKISDSTFENVCIIIFGPIAIVIALFYMIGDSASVSTNSSNEDDPVTEEYDEYVLLCMELQEIFLENSTKISKGNIASAQKLGNICIKPKHHKDHDELASFDDDYGKELILKIMEAAFSQIDFLYTESESTTAQKRKRSLSNIINKLGGNAPIIENNDDKNESKKIKKGSKNSGSIHINLKSRTAAESQDVIVNEENTVKAEAEEIKPSAESQNTESLEEEPQPRKKYTIEIK